MKSISYWHMKLDWYIQTNNHTRAWNYFLFLCWIKCALKPFSFFFLQMKFQISNKWNGIRPSQRSHCWLQWSVIKYNNVLMMEQKAIIACSCGIIGSILRHYGRKRERAWFGKYQRMKRNVYKGKEGLMGLPLILN
jgi:hypothetical protein